MKNCFRWLSVALFAGVLTACLAFPHRLPNPFVESVAESIPLFILAGQSNLQGLAGDAAAYPDDPLQLDSSIPFYWAIPATKFRSQGWTRLGPQEGLFPAGHFGPEISFARRITQLEANPIAVFKFSQGGTGLAIDWKRPGEGGLYDQFCQEYIQAIELLRQQGKEPQPRALVWIQGENDAYTPELAAEYQGRLQLLIEDFRENQLDLPQLPVVLGLDEQHLWVLENPEVITAQEAIAAADPNIIRTSMVGLEKADPTHLTPAALVEHGDRLAEAYLELR